MIGSQLPVSLSVQTSMLVDQKPNGSSPRSPRSGYHQRSARLFEVPAIGQAHLLTNRADRRLNNGPVSLFNPGVRRRRRVHPDARMRVPAAEGPHLWRSDGSPRSFVPRS